MSAEKLKDVQSAYAELENAKVAAKQATTKVKDMLASAQAAMDAAIELGIPANASAHDINAKLNRVEAAYADLEDAKVACKEIRASARDVMKEARKRLADAVKASHEVKIDEDGVVQD